MAHLCKDFPRESPPTASVAAAAKTTAAPHPCALWFWRALPTRTTSKKFDREKSGCPLKKSRKHRHLQHIESANEAADNIRRNVPEVLSGIFDTDTSISAMKFIMLCERRHCEISFNGKRPPSTSTIVLTMTAVAIINVAASYLGFEL